MKVKKAYLYSAIALLLVATSVFFTIFGNNGKAYNYAKKDLSKYVSGLVYEGINIDGVELEKIADDKSDVHAKIAALLKAAVMKNNSNKLPVPTKGTIDGYDIAVINYYGVYNDGEKDVIFTAGSTMNPFLGNDFQIHATADVNKLFGEDLNKLVSDALNNKNVADYSYNTYSTGYLHGNDVVYISYTTTAEGAKEQANVRIDLKDGQAAVDAVYGAGFYDKLLATPIAQKLKATDKAPLTFGDKGYSTITVNWAVRDTFNKANEAFKENDVIFAIVSYKDANNKTEFAVRINKGADSAYTYDAYNLTRGEAVLADSTTRIPEEVIKKICTSVLNGSGNVQYEKVEGDLTAAWSSGDHYVYVEDVYVEVNQTEVTAPAKDVTYYTRQEKTDEPGVFEYVKVAAGLTEWAADTAYYTLTKAHYEKVDKTVVTAPDGEETYYVYLGDYSYNVKSVIRPGADAADIKVAFDGIEISYTFAEDAKDKAEDGTELKGKTVKYFLFPTGVREMKTSYTNISAISGGFDSLDAKRLVAIKTALNSYDTALKAVNDMFGDKDLVDAYVKALKAYRADDAQKPPYETAYNALVALSVEGKTEQNKKDTLSKFETAYDALMRTVAVYYSEKVAEDIVAADKAHAEALAALNTFFGEANAATVTAYVDALKAVRADKDNEEKKTAYTDAKTALEALTVEGDKAATIAAYETAYDAFNGVVGASYSDVDKAIEVSKAIVAAKEALNVFGDEDKVEAYVNAWLTHISSANDSNKTAYETARDALVALTVDGKDEEAKKALCNAYEEAYKALAGVVKSAGFHVVEAWLDEQAFDVLLVDAEEDLEAEYKNDYINEVAALLWETMLEGVTVELPRRAVRLANKDQMDYYKQQYYTSKYKTYDSFKDYMKNDAFKGVDDYKAAVKADAEQMVKEHLVVFYLADLLGIDVSEKAITEDDTYAYRYMSLPEQTQTAYAFDKSMDKLLDEVYSSKLATPRN